MNPTFFKTPCAFRKWLTANHAKSKEFWVGFYKKGSGKPSITWPESVDEALCFGWIDGVRKRIDEDSYVIRFTPRKTSSVWSNINIRNAEKLIAEKRMQPAGLKAYGCEKKIDRAFILTNSAAPNSKRSTRGSSNETRPPGSSFKRSRLPIAK